MTDMHIFTSAAWALIIVSLITALNIYIGNRLEDRYDFDFGLTFGIFSFVETIILLFILGSL